LLPLFNKNANTVGKVVSGLVEILDDEKKKTELLRALQDRKAKVSICELRNLLID